MTPTKKKIVVVGGGAGGLELVAKLCNKFKNTIDITLVDSQLKHVWKPLYHEIAAGTFRNYHEQIDYISYSYQKGFTFVLGNLKQIDRAKKCILLEPILIDENSERSLNYDVLVLAIGSKINDFHIPGVTEHALFLDSLPEAELCNKSLLNQIIRATQADKKHIDINIIGGGATGIELAAEVNHVLNEARKYTKKNQVTPYHFQVTVIEAGKRILTMLPERISNAVSHYLQKQHINLVTNTQITAIQKNGLTTATGNFIPSDMTIWAAGVKGNTSTIQHDLAINHAQQFLVKNTLQTTLDDDIFAFGDCAACLQIDKHGKEYLVPPRAQAAHQQANMLVKSIQCYLQQKSLPIFHYRDYGSLISLSHNVVGNLMSKVAKSLYIEGMIARFVYWSLYKKHMAAIKGMKYVILSTLADLFMRKQRPDIKLH